MGRIAENQGGVNEYYLGDALGSVRQLVNDGGEIILARAYEPYGDLAQATGTAQTDYGFTGELTDASGLVYLRARYYAPEQGRFITRDTWEGNINTPASLNRFNYAHSNPVMYTDPSGHFAQIILGAALGGFIGLIGGRGFAELTYGWALQGKCGCEMQLWALNVGRPWIDQAARQSFVIGAVAGAVASTGPVGVIVVGAFGVTTSAIDTLRTVYQVAAQGGFDNCTLLRFVTDVVGYIGSAAAISAGANVLIDGPSPFTYLWKPRISRPDGGYKKGMMFDSEYYAMRQFAMKRGKPVDIAGGMAETENGLYNRAIGDPSVEDWRAGDTPTWTEVDVSEISQLTLEEQSIVKKIFRVGEIDTTGYSIVRYPNGQPYGSIRFNPDGTTTRILAPWQK